MQNRVKELRKKKGWNQTALAKKSNVSRQTISLIERNKLVPSVLIAIKIAKCFSEKVENIFLLDSTNYIKPSK